MPLFLFLFFPLVVSSIYNMRELLLSPYYLGSLHVAGLDIRQVHNLEVTCGGGGWNE